MTDLKVFIPCRLSSTRLPSKVLLPLEGLPILQHVYLRLLSVFPRDSIFIVTCDDKIISLANSFGAFSIKTSSAHLSGTSRINEAISMQQCDLALIVQADEPLLDPSVVSEFANSCLNCSDFHFSNLVSPLSSCDDLINPSVVKCVHTCNRLIYFFRNNPFTSNFVDILPFTKKLNGIYCYSSDVLKTSFSSCQTSFSLTESIEQLHLLEQGFDLSFYQSSVTYPDVNTHSDYLEVSRLLSTDDYQRSILRRVLH